MKFCLFDIDGTLIRSGGAGKRAFEAALSSEFGGDMTASNVPFSGRTDRAIVRDLFAEHGVEDTQANWQRFKKAYLEYLPSSLAALDGSVLPGIGPLLELFAARDDVALGLLTGNIAEGAQIKLTYYRIYDYFQFGGFGDVHFERDDVAREAFAAATDWHASGELRQEHVWVIGDTPLDVRCARAIGGRAVAVCTGSHSVAELDAENPDLLLDDLADPEPVLSAICGDSRA